jgi:hypothetical protein
MDVDGTEKVDLRTLGGADSTTVNDLSANGRRRGRGRISLRRSAAMPATALPTR